MFTLPERINPKAVAKQIPTLHQNPWAFLVVAVLIVVGSLLFHTFPSMDKLAQVKADIKNEEIRKEKLDNDIETTDLEREKAKEELALFEERDKPRLDKVFPDNEGITEMTRFLERFSLQLEKTGTITLNTISYGSSKNNGNYAELPIRLAFQANTHNFVKFMQMIKNSGSIKEKDFYEGEPVRLMRINRISVSIPSFTGGSADAEQLYSISLEISAFFHQN